MRKAIGCVAALLCLQLAGSARASDVRGTVVCSDGSPGLEAVAVTFTYGPYAFSTATQANGIYDVHVDYPYLTYAVSLDLTNVGGAADVAMGDFYVGMGTFDAPFVIGPLAVDVPACGVTPPPPPPPPVTTADCSPGFYKNHPGTWCDRCFEGVGCDLVVGQLSTGGSGGAAIREAAKAAIDACFVTAEESPCKDDDP